MRNVTAITWICKSLLWISLCQISGIVGPNDLDEHRLLQIIHITTSQHFTHMEVCWTEMTIKSRHTISAKIVWKLPTQESCVNMSSNECRQDPCHPQHWNTNAFSHEIKRMSPWPLSANTDGNGKQIDHGHCVSFKSVCTEVTKVLARRTRTLVWHNMKPSLQPRRQTATCVRCHKQTCQKTGV